MPGKRVAVLVFGPGLPSTGRRWGAYKTACRELNLDRSASQRHIDRQALKSRETLSLKGYTLTMCS